MPDKHNPWPQIKDQYNNPNDIFSLLLLVGGDNVQKAIARMVGIKIKVPHSNCDIQITPIAFSFGWVAYASSTLTAVAGTRRLMPPPERAVKLVNWKNGFVRDNESWLFSRLVNDCQSRVTEEEQRFREGEEKRRQQAGESFACRPDINERMSLLIDKFIAEPQVGRSPVRKTLVLQLCCHRRPIGRIQYPRNGLL
jgi:hypothetical protein